VFSFWLRKANPKTVVFYLQGGGGCFSAKTCAPDIERKPVDDVHCRGCRVG
jgi:hypothetical protein